MKSIKYRYIGVKARWLGKAKKNNLQMVRSICFALTQNHSVSLKICAMKSIPL